MNVVEDALRTPNSILFVVVLALELDQITARCPVVVGKASNLTQASKVHGPEKSKCVLSVSYTHLTLPTILRV